MEEKERRVRALTHIYYSKPEIQNYLVAFGQNREVVPRYYEGFGKRPDTIQYGSDVLGLVKKGATSFHASEEIWHDPLNIQSDLTPDEFHALRKGWDLLIDIDSPFLDCSKIAAQLLIAALESHGVVHYGLKFSGSKGLHILVPGKAFPQEYRGIAMHTMFPEWPRAISQYLMNYIRLDYNRAAAHVLRNVGAITERTKLSADELEGIRCKQCEKTAQKGIIISYVCPICTLHIDRRNTKSTKKRLKCLNNDCAGVLEEVGTKSYYYCEYCKDPSHTQLALSSDKYPDLFEEGVGVSAEKVAALDLVLVAPRHLFRMPYSLHEKTALASVVLQKEQLETFDIKDADPLRVKLLPFMPLDVVEGEARNLLGEALDWKKSQDARDERITQETFVKTLKQGTKKEYGETDFSGVTEDMFPIPIQKLLKGLHDGRKRGLFVLITFLRSLHFSPEDIAKRVQDWNTKNAVPLKEGYVRTQLEWHFRQKKEILPPNYENPAYYKDLGLLDKKPLSKNPVVDVKRALFSQRRSP